LKRRELVTLWPDSFIENIPVHAVWPKARSVTPKVRVVVDALAERFSPPPWDVVAIATSERSAEPSVRRTHSTDQFRVGRTLSGSQPGEHSIKVPFLFPKLPVSIDTGGRPNAATSVRNAFCELLGPETFERR
jgi:hypothetical protein